MGFNKIYRIYAVQALVLDLLFSFIYGIYLGLHRKDTDKNLIESFKILLILNSVK